MSAKVKVKEKDLTTRVQSIQSIRGAMAFPCIKGDTDKLIRVSNESNLLDLLTPNGKIEIGFDLGYQSLLNFLKKSNSCLVKRVSKNARYGGAIIKSTSTTSNSSFVAVPTSSTFTVSTGNAVVSTELFNKLTTGDPIVYTVSGGSAPSGLTHDTTYYIKKNASPNITLYPTQEDALENTNAITIGALNEGTTNTLTYTDPAGKLNPSAYDFGSDECMILYSANPGTWNNDLVIRITDYTNKEALAFKILVYKSTDTNNPVEEHICSRKRKTNGDGRNIYVEDKLLSSKYIRALNNEEIADTVLPTFITSTPLAFAGGTNGDTITDSEMIQALDSFRNTDTVKFTVLLDAGWSTVDYQASLAELAYNRQDCIVTASLPYEVESASDYMTEISNHVASLRSAIPEAHASYISFISPTQKVYDKFNDRDIWISADSFLAGAIAFSARNFEIWYPPAGWKRGGISSKQSLIEFTESERDELPDELCINPIRYSATRGTVVWGQKTFLNRPSVLDRLNVRLLTIILKPAIKELLENYVFDLSDEGDRNAIVTIIKQLMRNIQSRKGVTEFDVIADERNNSQDDINNYRLNVWLLIKPVLSQEEITLTVVLLKTGDSISVAVDLLGGQ